MQMLRLLGLGDLWGGKKLGQAPLFTVTKEWASVQVGVGRRNAGSPHAETFEGQDYKLDPIIEEIHPLISPTGAFRLACFFPFFSNSVFLAGIAGHVPSHRWHSFHAWYSSRGHRSCSRDTHSLASSEIKPSLGCWNIAGSTNVVFSNILSGLPWPCLPFSACVRERLALVKGARPMVLIYLRPAAAGLALLGSAQICLWPRKQLLPQPGHWQMLATPERMRIIAAAW